MGVGVERYADLGVAEALLDDLGVNPLGKQQGRRGVPQVVEPDVWEFGALQEWLELPEVEMASPPRAAGGVGEHPGHAGQAFLQQSLSVPIQRFHRHLRQFDPPPAPGGLRLRERESALQLLERVLDHNRSSFQVQVGPLEPEQFAQSHPGGHRQNVKRLLPIAAGGLQQSVHLLGAQRRDVWLGNGTRTSFVYDADDRLMSQLDLKADDSVITGVDYQYDNAGNRTRMREATGRLTTWTYDDSYQLIGEHRSSASGGFHITYTYDPVGNRLVKNSSGALTTSTYDAANQLQTATESNGVTTFIFDAAGNQQTEQASSGTTTRTWDYDNQQTGVVLPSGARVTMSYNADFRRVRKES